MGKERRRERNYSQKVASLWAVKDSLKWYMTKSGIKAAEKEEDLRDFGQESKPRSRYAQPELPRRE